MPRPSFFLPLALIPNDLELPVTLILSTESRR